MSCRIPATIVATALISTAAHAQSPMAGDTVRVLQGRFWITGTVVSIGDSLVVNARSGERRAVKLLSTTVVERPGGRGSRPFQGLLIGAIAGATLGAGVGLAVSTGCSSGSYCHDSQFSLLAGSAIGAGALGFLGLLIGAVPRPVWKQVEVGPATVAVEPRLASGFGFRAGLRLPLR